MLPSLLKLHSKLSALFLLPDIWEFLGCFTSKMILEQLINFRGKNLLAF
jgi:hypothetical protein